jgi:hypothetical protein
VAVYKCKLGVYQALNLQVPYHYANLVRFWRGRSLYRSIKKVSSGGFDPACLRWTAHRARLGRAT